MALTKRRSRSVRHGAYVTNSNQNFAVSSLYNGQCRDLELVSSLARTRGNSGSLLSQTVMFARDLATLRIIAVSVKVGCLQREC